jgi:phytoene dehydrogenase-like protein
MTKKLIIIGAGVAGLSTGCYARMNGYDAAIFELHNKPGGLCTSWKRKDYTFDYCIHNLAGTGNVGVKQVWDELNALKADEVINHDTFVRVEDSKGNALNVYTDPEKLEKHLKELAPEDSKLIEDYLKAGSSLMGADFFSMNLGGIGSKLKIAPQAYHLIKWGGITLEEYASKFQNEFLQKAFPHIQYNINGSDLPMFPHLLFLAGFKAGDLGWPKYGSLEFSKRIEKSFLESGGEIHYRSPVEKIIVENKQAVGVVLADGSKHQADVVISAADGHSTIYEMLEGKYTNKSIDSYYRSYEEEQSFGLQIYLGLKRNLSEEPHALVLLLDEPVNLELRERDSLYLELFDSSTGLAPEGKSVIKVVIDGNYGYWKDLHSDGDKYRQEKEAVYHKVLEVLDTRFPGIKEQVEIFDVTTPVTVERFTHNFHGWQPWPAKKGAMRIMLRGLSKTLPGLKNFYMVGQWAGAMIGISNAALTGRNIIKELCKKDGKKFQHKPS